MIKRIQIRQVIIMNLNKLFFILIVFNPVFMFAGPKDYPANYYDTIALLFIILIVLMFIAFMYYGTGEGKPEPVKEKKSSRQFSFINKYITGSTPIEKEGELLLQDDYDGIKELDNRVPPWFNYLFFLQFIICLITIFLNQVRSRRLNTLLKWKLQGC
jgi:cytochrome c oxidase cbb3-type subunit III